MSSSSFTMQIKRS